MPITRTNQVDDDGSGTTGTIVNNAWKQELYNQIDADVGPVLLPPFDAARYYGSGAMTWTVISANVVAEFYQVVNHMLVWNVSLQGTTIGGTPSNVLNITLPVGLTATSNAVAFGKVAQNSTGWVDLFLQAIGARLEINRFDVAPFVVDTNTYMRFQIHIPVA